MAFFENQDILERLRKTPPRFQRTFQTPLQALNSFVGTILSSYEQIDGGCVVIDEIVFPPNHLTAAIAKLSLLMPCQPRAALTVMGGNKVAVLLEAAFNDWVDFLFVPSPESFLMYADHDEYATFFAEENANLDRVVQSLLANGFEEATNYERRFCPQV